MSPCSNAKIFLFPIAPPQVFGVEYDVCHQHYLPGEDQSTARGSSRRRWTALQKFIGFISAVSSLWQQIPPLHGWKRTTDGDVWHEKVVTKHSVRHKTPSQDVASVLCQTLSTANHLWNGKWGELILEDNSQTGQPRVSWQAGASITRPLGSFFFFFLWNALQKKRLADSSKHCSENFWTEGGRGKAQRRSCNPNWTGIRAELN